MYKLINGNSLEILKTMDENSIDSIVTDPPYELGFMGKSWDSTGIAFNTELWKEALRVLKPGGHIVAFSGSRTYHRMAVAIEDAGFEIRDQIMWVYGSGFPKSLNISKAIDKKAGAEREVVGSKKSGSSSRAFQSESLTTAGQHNITAPATPEAIKYDGWGTALKPAHEPIVLARKPLSEKTVAENVLKWGTGAINIDRCRVETEDKLGRPQAENQEGVMSMGLKGNIFNNNSDISGGRWPANFIHDGSEEVVSLFPDSNGGGKRTSKNNKVSPENMLLYTPKESIYSDNNTYDDKGSAARFFYCAKASKKDRNSGCDDLELKANRVNAPRESEEKKFSTLSNNNHPTVKPTDLMSYLCKLITPVNGIILDPFNGSGSTGKAAVRDKFNYIGIDLSQEYLDISKARIDDVLNKNC